MSNNTIKILCPPKSCGKCQRLIRKVEEMLKENALHAEIIVVKAMDEVQKYPTWILPTVVINEQVVSRGYAPDIITLKNYVFDA